MFMELEEHIHDKIKETDRMLLQRVIEKFQSRLQDSPVLDNT
jgi:hypothetical protein